MPQKQMRVKVKTNYRVDGFDLLFIQVDRTDEMNVGVIESIIMKIVPVYEAVEQHPISIDREVAAKLMDQLWNFGIRPTDYREMHGEISAMASHITDLQNILARLLDFITKGLS